MSDLPQERKTGPSLRCIPMRLRTDESLKLYCRELGTGFRDSCEFLNRLLLLLPPGGGKSCELIRTDVSADESFAVAWGPTYWQPSDFVVNEHMASVC